MMERTIVTLAEMLRVQCPSVRLLVDEPVAPYTSYAIGGPADLLAVVHDPEETVAVMRAAWQSSTPTLVLGGGTNVLVADAGVRGLVVINRCDHCEIDETGLLVAQSGAMLRQVARWATERGWAGLEWAVGVPGTVGGGVVGNAGAYGGCMADRVIWVDVLHTDGQQERLGVRALDYVYRSSAIKREAGPGRTLVLRAGLQLKPGDAEQLTAAAARYSAQREARTPKGCCAGSVFKRTAHYPAGFLIDQAGLKGYRIGGAQVSPKHANFLMNAGGATAQDVRALIDHVGRVVWDQFSVRLDREIEYVGDWREPDRSAR